MQNLECLMYFFNVFNLKCYESYGGTVLSVVELHLVVFGCVNVADTSVWTFLQYLRKT